MIKKLVGVVVCVFLFSLAMADEQKGDVLFKDGAQWAPDGWLLASAGRGWWYEIQPSPFSMELQRRSPSEEEQKIIFKASKMFEKGPGKALALLDGREVKGEFFKPDVGPKSTFFGFSMGKMVTAMGVGKALCSNALTMETRADVLIPQLRDTALGAATVRDLLKMSSGTLLGHNESFLSPEGQKNWDTVGTVSFMQMLSEPRVTAAAKGVFSAYKPGEIWSYKATDPVVLGVMVAAASGVPWAHFLQKEVFDSAGLANKGLYVQDREQAGRAEAGVRIRFEDWLRFAAWVKSESLEVGCFGDFVREASKVQIRIPGESKGGYGYFLWIEQGVPGAFWAIGHGGQRIAWNTKNNRMVVAFSNSSSWNEELTRIARDWLALPSR